MTTKRSRRFISIDYIILAFGILIAGPRLSGAFAAAIGIDLMSVDPVWAWIEIGSGWALAVFEMLALARIASRFRGIRILNDNEAQPISKRIVWTNAVYWVMLLVGQVVLLFTIPMIASVHIATQLFRGSEGEYLGVANVLTWSNIWQHHLAWLWIILVSAASTLFVFLLGLVMHDPLPVIRSEDSDTESDKRYRTFMCYEQLKETMAIVEPDALSKEASIPLHEAAEFLDGLLNAQPPIGHAQERLNRLKNNGQ